MIIPNYLGHVMNIPNYLGHVMIIPNHLGHFIMIVPKQTGHAKCDRT